MAVLPGRRFVLGARLGGGGFGEVYAASMATAGGLTREVALKVARSGVALDPGAAARLRDEGRVLSALSHPDIVRALDLCTLVTPDGGPRVALVTEVVDGVELGTALAASPGLSPRAVAEVLARVGRALDAVHRAPLSDRRLQGLVHRDLKPANVLLGRSGEVRLLDFGVAWFEHGDREARTATAVLVGSWGYLAPERWQAVSATSASDVFALGVVVAEALTGQPLWGDASARDLGALAVDPARYGARIAAALAGVPDAVRATLAAALAWTPSERPSAAAVADALEALAATLPGAGWRVACRSIPATAAGRPGPWTGQVWVDSGAEGPAPPPQVARAGGAMPRVLRVAAGTVDPGAIALADVADASPVSADRPLASAAAPSPARRRWPLLALGFGAMLGVVGCGGSIAAVATALAWGGW
jgi:serine/threonine protein kinase